LDIGYVSTRLALKETSLVTETLGLIGSGMIGSALARLAVAAGLDVVVSNSRGPETLGAFIAELGLQARAGTPAEAAEAGDVVVAAIPLNAYHRLSRVELAGKTVIDTMNYYPQRDGRIAELDTGASTSSALVQRHLSGSRVVKAFNNIDFRRLYTLALPYGAPDRSALPIAGDAAAKSEVAELLDILGYHATDIGTLDDSWRSEPGTPVYCLPYFPGQAPEGVSPHEAFRWFFETPGVPVSADRVRDLTAGAVRGPAGGHVPEMAASLAGLDTRQSASPVASLTPAPSRVAS
jgi:predicted dinucleotide-binding enzyme